MTDCEREHMSVKEDTEILTSGWWEYRNILMVNIFLNCYKLSMIVSITSPGKQTQIKQLHGFISVSPPAALSTVFNFCSCFSSLRAAHGKWGPQANSWCLLEMQTLLPESDSLGLKPWGVCVLTSSLGDSEREEV